MNKKKALFTSLAALALASTAQVGFAEEVDATIAEPTVADVLATEEVAQDAPVAEAVAEEVAAVEAPAEEVAPVSETPSEEPVAAASAGEEVVADIDVLAILSGDYSSAYGVWENAEGAQIQFESFDITGVEELQNGSIQISTTSIHQSYHLVPAETEREILGTATDASQPRLIDVLSRGGGFSADKSVYYRVAETSPAEEPIAQPVVEESTPVETVVSATDAILANDFSPIAGQWATADGKTLEVSSTGTINLSDGRTYTVYGTAQGSDSDGISFVMPIAGFGIAYHPGVDEITTGSGIWGSVPDVYKRVVQAAVQETPTPVSTALVGTWAGESADGLPTHVAQVDQIVIAEDGSYTIYQTNRITGAKEEKVGQITSMEQIGENRYLITETGGLSGIYSPGFVTADKVETGLEIFADKFGVFYIITDVQTGEKTETAPIRYLTRVTPAVETPVVTETAAPTTSEVVHVPLTAKTEATVEQATPAKPSYSRSEKAQAEKTAQSEKGILPSTGEVTSVLSALGAGLSALGLAGLRRRK